MSQIKNPSDFENWLEMNVLTESDNQEDVEPEGEDVGFIPRLFG